MTANYKAIKAKCDEDSRISEEMVDNHLMYYAALNEMMPLINEGKRPDYDALARKYNTDADALRNIAEDVLGKMGY